MLIHSRCESLHLPTPGSQSIFLRPCLGNHKSVLINIIIQDICIYYFTLFYWPHCVACGILVLQPGMEPVPSAVDAGSLNWTTRDVPIIDSSLAYLLHLLLEAESWACPHVVLLSPTGWHHPWHRGGKDNIPWCPGFAHLSDPGYLCSLHGLESSSLTKEQPWETLMRQMWESGNHGRESLQCSRFLVIYAFKKFI